MPPAGVWRGVMDDELFVPPKNKRLLTPPGTLARRLVSLIGKPFPLSGKTRTDGSNLRKLIAATLGSGKLPIRARPDSWKCMVPKRKGVPRLLREFVETYLVTSGDSYNLQVWNRNPASPSVQIEYDDGSALGANEVRFVLARVDSEKHTIRCIAVLTPDYIVEHFGAFGKPTVKEQLIISEVARQRVYAIRPPVLFHPDDHAVANLVASSVPPAGTTIHEFAAPGKIMSLETVRPLVAKALLGRRIESRATKDRGQELELLVSHTLGLTVRPNDLLIGGFPDIRSQALEVKIQDSPTVDLGRYSPQFAEELVGCLGFTTQTVRYLIALMDTVTSTCAGLVLCPGVRLGDHFAYVADKSFKCQRAIPMTFFDAIDGRSVFNPHWRRPSKSPRKPKP
jgi:hypothetical protein